MTSCAFTRGESNSGRESDFGTTPRGSRIRHTALSSLSVGVIHKKRVLISIEIRFCWIYRSMKSPLKPAVFLVLMCGK